MTLPFGTVFLLNFSDGILDKRSTRLDLESGATADFFFENGTFKRRRQGSGVAGLFFGELAAKKTFRSNWALKPTSHYSSGKFFGSFLLENGKTFHGLIIDGSPTSWGVSVKFAPIKGSGS